MTNPISVAEAVARATASAQAGVSISVQCGIDPAYVISSVRPDGRRNLHTLNCACTDEARLTAHVLGFIENVRK